MILAQRILLGCLLFPFRCISQGKNDNVQAFLPKVFSQFPNVRDISISPHGNEIYFTIQSLGGELSAIGYIINERGKWTKPKVLSCSGQYHDLEPFITHDGLELFFASDRPLSKDSSRKKDYDLWYVVRKDIHSQWSEPKNIGTPVNTSANEFYPSLSINNSLYFTSDAPKSVGKDDIFYSQYTNGQYNEPISLSDSINTSGYEFNAFIAPDESYLIYTGYNKPGGWGSGDLFISYRINDSTWSSGKNLGEKVNSKQMDYCPFVSEKTGRLYFTSKRNMLIDTLKKFENTEQLLKEMNRYENGSSRIYQTDIKTFRK